MSVTIIEATKSSPRVELNPEGEIVIQGRSIIEDTAAFYNPIIDWVNNVSCKSMIIEIRFEYMNTSSSKYLLSILKAAAANPFFTARYVKWFYEEDDEDMLDLGKDYESIIHIPFDFYEYSGDLI